MRPPSIVRCANVKDEVGREVFVLYIHLVYAQMSLFMSENDNAFLDSHHHTLACEWTNHRAGSQLKIYFYFCRKNYRGQGTGQGDHIFLDGQVGSGHTLYG